MGIEHRACWALVLCFILASHHVASQVLNPPYFNLAEGRIIYASATCGENVTEPELYCKLVGSNWLDNPEIVNLIDGQACDYCDPNDPKRAHPAIYAIDGTEKWWQSPPLSRGAKYAEVNLTMDLGQEFNVAYVFIKMGNSPRPGVWILERSRDFGRTYTPWQYFADTPQDCVNFFGKMSLQPITRDDSVICETKFSKLVPLEGGEIAISLLNGRPSADNFTNSAVLQEWTTATNIQLRMLRPKTTMGQLISMNREDPTVTRRIFISIKDINIGGRCVCNGHASQCDQISPNDPYKVSCNCQHNTCGSQCEKCCNGYQQYEWRRATVSDPFVCEKCNCHGHSQECFFDSEVFANNTSMNIHGEYSGGGVCVNCQHNTTGINCHKCRDGFFRPRGKSLDAIDVCQPCQCNNQFSTGNCFDETGQCECRKNYRSPDCDQCSYGYFGFPVCQECHCYPNGTIGNVCELQTGDCPCREGYAGRFCKECAESYHGYPNCEWCRCNMEHAIDNRCDRETGQCRCKAEYGGKTCEQCSVGYSNYPKCSFCLCSREGTTEEICDRDTGRCLCKPGYSGGSCNRCAEGFFGYPNCTRCECNAEGSLDQTCDQWGKCRCKGNYGGLKCDDCSPGFFNFPKCEPCACHWKGSTGSSCDHSGNCLCLDRFEGQKCDKCKEGYYNFPVCEECNCNPAGLVAEFGGCDKVEIGKLCECKERVKGRICNQCKDLYWNLQMNNAAGCEECLCNQNGTVSRLGLCNSQSGECMCKDNVQGRTCDTCKPNTYLLDSANLFGCVDCGCDIGGAISADCEKTSGQCQCKSRVRGRTCSQTIDATYFPTFYQFKYEAEDWYNPMSGSQARFAYDEDVFPDYSWRGYATFNHLQKEILTNISVAKASNYKVIVRYVNRNAEPANGFLKFTPNDWMSDVEQNVPIVFEPSLLPRLQLVTPQRPASGVIALGVGPWTMSLKSDKYDLFIDYVVLIPEAYYLPTLFQDRTITPCLYSINNQTCLQYSYPEYPEDSKSLSAANAFVIEPNAQTSPQVIDDAEYRDKLGNFVQINSRDTNLAFDIQPEINGTNLVVLNYHTPTNVNRSIPVKIELFNVAKNETFESQTILSACPFAFVCRQLITTGEGQILTFEVLKDELYKFRITLMGTEEEQPSDLYSKEFNVNSITIVPFDQRWSFDYVTPNFVCIKKDGNCLTTNFPSAEGFKLEAESEQKRDRAVELPNYNHTPGGSEAGKPLLVHINSTSPSIDIRGSVPEPGSYAFILHYSQPKNPSFELEALIQDGQFYSGIAPVKYCPNIVGCRVAIRQRESEGNSNLFFIQKNFMITLKTPGNMEAAIDYLLVVPAYAFDPSLLETDTKDHSKNILAECIQSNFYIDPNTTSDHCRALIFSTTVNFNGGALPCDCNIDGAHDYKCNSFGGQCLCKPNVIGRDCSKCKTGYYGFPNCKKCDCPSTAICHAKTGDCICPKGVTGKNCDQCLPLTFGFDKIIGCVDCACNSKGVENRDLRCDLETGDCTCKRNIVGRTCDKCKPGFFGFPKCQLCRCDIRGTTEEICDQRNARCHCKKNVDGPYCDKCKADSYYLEESNMLGCTKCFCFGNTDRCTSSTLIFTQVFMVNKELDLYHLNIGEQSLDAKLLKKNEDYELDYSEGKFTIRTGLSRDSDHQSSVYLALPQEYLGHKITSYGGQFQYRIINKIASTELISAVPLPDLIFIGRNFTLIHEHLEQPIINEDFRISIRLLEKEFKRLDGSYVTREQLMMTLVNVQAIYIRIKYFDSNQDIIEIELQDIQMDMGIPGNRISDAPKGLSVEQCICPPNYKGTSCEECAEGYYRVRQGPYLGACVPCNCNGHSNECDPVTGKCFNCKYNTVGDHCERCVQGFYGDATLGTPYDCLICACPLPIESNNFATSCDVSSSGSVLSCQCKEGYNGTRCELCAAGHFGQPQLQGYTCERCQCNGNIEVTDPESCNLITGVCTKCLFNSSGEHCERCADWYYGDSINSKNCTDCSCDKCGAEYCDHRTGSCKCKPNVIGENCDRCAPGFYGFSTCSGCQPCNCNEAAHDLNCDDSGQCSCKTGVTGKTCGTCKPGFWGYSKYGCTSCGCNEKYSRVKQCNQFTGQCQCLPGVVGAKCEQCPDRWVLVPETGCQECGNCVHVLLNDTDSLSSWIDPAQDDLKDSSSAVLALRKLSSVKNRLDEATKEFQKTFDETEERKWTMANFTMVKANSSELDESIASLDGKSDSLEKDFKLQVLRANTIHNNSVAIDATVKSIKQFTVQVIENINQLEYSYINTSTLDNINTKVAESEQILKDLQQFTVQDENRLNMSLFYDTQNMADEFVAPWVEMKNDIVVSSNRLGNISVLMAELKNLTNLAVTKTVEAENIARNPLKNNLLETIENIKSDFNRSVVQINVEAQSILSDGKAIFPSLSSMPIDIEQQNTRLEERIVLLNETHSRNRKGISEVYPAVSEAQQHAKEQKAQIESLNQLFASTKDSAVDPLRAANAYNNISIRVQESDENLQKMRQDIEPYLDGKSKLLFHGELDATKEKVQFDMGQMARESLRQVSQGQTIEELDSKLKKDKEQADFIKDQLNTLDETYSSKPPGADYQNIKKMVMGVKDTNDKIGKMMNSIDQLQMESRGIKEYSEFVSDLKESRDFVDRFGRDVERTKNITSTDDIDELNADFAKTKATISSKIAELKKRIQLAIHQTNSIRVGANFTHDSVLELNNPINLVESSTYNRFSLQFRAQTPEGLLAYIGNPTDAARMVKREVRYEAHQRVINYDYMCLEIRNGHVVLTWDLGSGQPNMLEDEQNVYDDKWHQVTVERFGRIMKLNVKTNEVVTKHEASSNGLPSVFNLDRRSSKIFIGGISDSVQVSPAVVNRHFVGTISNCMLDNEELGLWNSRKAQNVLGASAHSFFTENTMRFNGNSYLILSKGQYDFREVTYVNFMFKTMSRNGLIFLVGDPGKKVYFAIEINDGKVMVRYELGSAPIQVFSKFTYNDSQWHSVKVNREGKECFLTVDNNDEQSGFPMGLSTDLSTDDNIYIGGYRGLMPYFDVTKEGFEGCIKELQIDSNPHNLNNYKEAFGVSLGCATFVRVASFAEQVKAYVVITNPEASADSLQLTVKFRTLYKTGLLLHLTNEEKALYLHMYLDNGMLLLRMSNGQFIRTENQYYNDNKWHYITLAVNSQVMKVDVDDQHSFILDLSESIDLSQLNTIYVGGMPKDMSDHFSTLFNEFVGCIGDITLNERFINFADANQTMNVQFNKCPLASNEDEFSVSSFRETSVTETVTRPPSQHNLPPINGCVLPPIPKEDVDSYRLEEMRFGNSLWSRYEFSISNDVSRGLDEESGFQIEFKTTQASGVIFYITSSNNIDFIGLYFLDNRLHYSFDCGSGRGVVSLDGDYSNGEWHKITFSRSKKIGIIRVDEIEEKTLASAGPANSLNVRSPIYVGGIPKDLSSQVKSHLKHVDKNNYTHAMTSFSGCLRNLRLRDLEYRFRDGREFDVAPCSSLVEDGHFFHYDGGYLRLYDEFRVKVEFQLILDIKPRKPDGILMAVFGQIDYLVLYLDKGTLYFAVHNGAVPIIASLNFTCDGQWHTISAIKTKNIVMLSIDNGPQSIGTGQAGISSTDTKDPLYFGGMPAKLKEEKKLQINSVTDDYLGCMRIQSINMNSPSLFHSKVEGRVTLNSCPIN